MDVITQLLANRRGWAGIIGLIVPTIVTVAAFAGVTVTPEVVQPYFEQVCAGIAGVLALVSLFRPKEA